MLITQQEHAGLVAELVAGGGPRAGRAPVALEARRGFSVFVQQGLVMLVLRKDVRHPFRPGVGKEADEVELKVHPASSAIVREEKVELFLKVLLALELLYVFLRLVVLRAGGRRSLRVVIVATLAPASTPTPSTTTSTSEPTSTTPATVPPVATLMAALENLTSVETLRMAAVGRSMV